jgi:hypothetical protein
VRILSLGAGVQSSTLLLMACEGEEHLDAAIFADTGWEPWWVYQHLEGLEKVAKVAGIPLYRVSAGSLRTDALAGATASWMPVYSRDPETGKVQQLKRQCTRNYKIRPIRRQVALLNGGFRRRVDQVVGISLDEYERMRDSDVKYIRNVYPLVERRMTRADCVAWLRPPRVPGAAQVLLHRLSTAHRRRVARDSRRPAVVGERDGFRRARPPDSVPNQAAGGVRLAPGGPACGGRLAF